MDVSGIKSDANIDLLFHEKTVGSQEWNKTLEHLFLTMTKDLDSIIQCPSISQVMLGIALLAPRHDCFPLILQVKNDHRTDCIFILF